MIVRDNKEDLFEGLKQIRDTIVVKDTEGNDMVLWETFDGIYKENIK